MYHKNKKMGPMILANDLKMKVTVALTYVNELSVYFFTECICTISNNVLYIVSEDDPYVMT